MPKVEYRQIMNRDAICNDCGKKFSKGDYAYFVYAPTVYVTICKECYKEIRKALNKIEDSFGKKVRKND